MGGIYNVTDSAPLPDAAAVAEACRLLSVPAPPEEDAATAALNPIQASLFAGCVRVRRALITTELNVVPRHANIFHGLQAIVESGRRQDDMKSS